MTSLSGPNFLNVIVIFFFFGLLILISESVLGLFQCIGFSPHYRSYLSFFLACLVIFD